MTLPRSAAGKPVVDLTGLKLQPWLRESATLDRLQGVDGATFLRLDCHHHLFHDAFVTFLNEPRTTVQALRNRP